MYFLECISLRKIMKKGLFIHGSCEADVARCGHVANPREPTQNHVDAYVALSETGCVCVGPRV